MISIKVHGYIDYIAAALLILVPWLFYPMKMVGTRMSVLMGGLLLLYNLFTDYQLGVSPTIPLRTHLVLDRICGITLIVSSLVLGIANPMLALIGIVLFVVSMNTSYPYTVWEKVQRLLRRNSRRLSAKSIHNNSDSEKGKVRQGKR